MGLQMLKFVPILSMILKEKYFRKSEPKKVELMTHEGC